MHHNLMVLQLFYNAVLWYHKEHKEHMVPQGTHGNTRQYMVTLASFTAQSKTHSTARIIKFRNRNKVFRSLVECDYDCLH